MILFRVSVILADLYLAGLSVYQVFHTYHHPEYVWILWVAAFGYFVQDFGKECDKLFKA